MKRYIDIIVRYTKDGHIISLAVRWSAGELFEIDKVLDVQRMASLWAGGTRIRYLCRMKEQERYIQLENNRWSIEGKD